MGRVGRKTGVQVTSRLTWTFSVRAGRGRSRATRSALPAPVSEAGRLMSLALLRTALRAVRGRPRRPAPPAVRARCGRRR
ncbi:hypothetical protein J2X68_002502 [Streptomyces sp. 3330]|uniref:hypothetical protein n=1 Tax=Streptomyces sp. 3330 TaxID=2817755 RepID=UPI00285C0E63|nr:hypothetical protein [Streptomyces sp. 3330]MDR6975814.1 hypothetical protein [Streptomyces sp. 3330]